jgi:hypothetical protein
MIQNQMTTSGTLLSRPGVAWSARVVELVVVVTASIVRVAGHQWRCPESATGKSVAAA